jgi:hypothetical protein
MEMPGAGEKMLSVLLQTKVSRNMDGESSVEFVRAGGERPN